MPKPTHTSEADLEHPAYKHTIYCGTYDIVTDEIRNDALEIAAKCEACDYGKRSCFKECMYKPMRERALIEKTY